MPRLPNRPRSRQPIPTHAQRVYKGALFEVYQWKQELFDGSQASFEKISRPDTAYVIPVTDTRKLAIVKQHQSGSSPYYGLIGGRVEEGETPEAAAKRELTEEAGLTASRLDLLDSFQFLPKIEWAIFIYVARPPFQFNASSQDPGEKIEIVHVSFDKFLALVADEQFGDVEVALRFLRRCATVKGVEETRKALGVD